ncbi:uncharacterized protein N7503_010836 [Penicillium pulvis]|uniref:uncharacterized protein n=1 Tax=Penicillium pulvis TaxID=1562058 RepID=UPI0025495845|nr:uncharacterized protein N7503_010836 [Penicillium pulvis]KAJ5785624.1 hypothetical protein N7503_010836 [Penicillium pulvis]
MSESPVAFCSNSDNTFVVRVNPNCRAFDFTLFFEDVFFSVLPASTFLLLAIPHILIWRKQTIKLSSPKLAIYKLILLSLLFALSSAFLAFRLRDEALFTNIALASSILDTAANGTAIVLSFLADQRAINPSYLLSLYFSLGSVLSIPRLRSLWLINSDQTCRSIWTAIFTLTVLVALAESVNKEAILLPDVRDKASKEEIHGLWGRSFFTWTNSVFKNGYRAALQVDDLPDVDNSLQASLAGEKIHRAWTKGSHETKRYRLIRATLRAYFWPFLSAIIPRLILIAFKFCQPFLITAAVNYVSRPKASPDYFGQALIGAFVLEYFSMAVVTSIYWRQAFRFVTMIRAGLVSMIHRRLMQSRTVDVKESEAVTLMEVDVDRIVRVLRNLHEIWACLVEIIIAIWLLEREMGAVCVVPALISILSVAASLPVSKRFKISQQLWVQRIGERVITTAGVLSNIKAVKMLGLNKAVYSLVTELRELELQTSQHFRKLLIWTIALSNVPSDFAPFATFLVYAIVSIVKGNGYLLSAQAFTSLSLISLLTSPLLTFIQTTPGLFQSEACFNRIEEFYTQISPEDLDTINDREQDDELIILDNASFSWNSDSQPVLQNVDLVIGRKSITLVTGPVGSGKTALLESIMGETTLREGTLTVKTSRIAYCSQNAWIINDTIRSNITGHGEIDEKWYDFVLQVCCLKGDLQRIPQGDMFTCGSGGVALSGGQKQRIALARAIYSKAEAIVLDDIFAGLDPKTLSSISTQLFSDNGYFREAGKTVIIVTQNPRLVHFADNTISLNNGILSSQIKSKGEIELDKPESLGEWEFAEGPSEETSPLESTDNTANTKSREDKKDDQSRQKGGSGVYRFYLKRSGVGVVVCFIAAMNLEAACGNVASVWIQQWSSANAKDQKDHVGMYLGVTDLGSLVNSEDMTLIDMNLPVDAINVAGSSASCIAKVIIACVFGKYLTAAMPVLVAVICLVQSYYLRTSRQVRLLDIEAKAPLVSHFLETMQGITTLKALGWSSHFQKAFESSFVVSQKPFYMLYCIQQWLTLVLDLITGTMAIILIAITASLRDHFSGGSVGVALYMIMTLNQALAQLINYWISLETSIGAVYRVKTFLQDTPSESDHACSTESSFSKGAIEIANLTVSYNPSTAPVLKGLSLNILPGEKVAICGQSGSGKTSLVLALLQMMEVQDGYIKIDETNLAGLKPDSLRACLSVVSQDQFLLPGTVRLNMDPYKRTSDETIQQALNLVGLWNRISSGGGLEMKLKSSEWSVGEKQLLALARAMVIRSPVLILDEATSSVDLDTEALMQRVIADHFSSQTVVSVIHRFGNIRQFDRVILIKDGVMVENDSPATLLGAESELRKLYDLTQQTI